jgi:hypothetical protein
MLITDKLKSYQAARQKLMPIERVIPCPFQALVTILGNSNRRESTNHKQKR